MCKLHWYCSSNSKQLRQRAEWKSKKWLLTRTSRASKFQGSAIAMGFAFHLLMVWISWNTINCSSPEVACTSITLVSPFQFPESLLFFVKGFEHILFVASLYWGELDSTKAKTFENQGKSAACLVSADQAFRRCDHFRPLSPSDHTAHTHLLSPSCSRLSGFFSTSAHPIQCFCKQGLLICWQ